MDPFTIGAIAAPVIGGMIGGQAGAGDRSAANAILNDIYNQYKNLKVPTIESQQINPELMAVVGQLDPSMENALTLGSRDALQDIQLDPRLKNTQMDSLKMLEDIAKGGLTPSDRARLNATRRATQSDVNAQLNSMLQQQEQRGVGSSDASLALRSNAAQSAANRASAEMDREQAMAFERALAATEQAGTLAGNIEQADYGRQAALANALNQREQTNLNQRTGAQTRNIDRFNQAQQANLVNRQDVANQNVGIRNAAQTHNKGLNQTQFQNELSKLSGASGAGGAKADNLNESAKAKETMWGEMGSGAGKMLLGASGLNSNKKGKQGGVP